MPGNVIGKIPEFTTDEPPTPANPGKEEVKQATDEEPVEKVREIPTQLPGEQKPAIPQQPIITKQSVEGDNTEGLKQVEGLTQEKARLLDEIKELRGTRREIKQQEIEKVQKKMDDLKDLNPGDVEIIDRINKARGFLSAEEAQKMFYNYVVEDEKAKFLDRFPEYKPENDTNDINWNALMRELGLYRRPEDPHLIGQLLQRAHQSIQRVPSDPTTVPVKKRQAEVAGVGGGGSQRSPSQRKTLDPQKRVYLEQGGWSEEEIKKMEENLT